MPKPLPPGGNIRVISPGFPSIALIPKRAQRAERALRAQGFEVSYGRHAFMVGEDDLTAGSPAERAADLMEAFEDPTVDAILVSDSGLGSSELIPLLDANVIAANAKPFIGYCDTVFLHHYLAVQAGISSFIGCALMVNWGEAGGPFPETIESFRDALMSDAPLVCRPAQTRTRKFVNMFVAKHEAAPRDRTEPGGWTWLRGGRGRGPLFGGEISILPDLVKEFDIHWEDKVLFWDVAFTNKLPTRPQLEALCGCTDLSGLAGMIVGAHPRLGLAEWAAELAQVVADLLPGTTFPILANADLSHVAPTWIVPYGAEVVLDDTEGVTFTRLPGMRRELAGWSREPRPVRRTVGQDSSAV
jgi:muramoyltetrapeptide carboxypeptidase